MTITITGSNTYLTKLRLNKLIDEFAKQHGLLAVERLDLADQKIDAVNKAVSSPPFLANRKMVVVRGLSETKPTTKDIEQILSSKSETTNLVIYEPLTDKKSEIYKILKAKTELEEYKNLNDFELAKWLVEQAKKGGGQLLLPDAKYMVERVGSNQTMLANELEKLILYSPKIIRQNIELLTEPTPQSRVFDLLDATFSGNKKKALKLYEEQRSQKIEPSALVAMVVWQLRLMALVKHAQGKSAAEIAKDSKLSTYPIGKAMRISSKVSEAKIQQMVNEIFDIDVKSKTSALNLDDALKTYISIL